MREDTDRGVEGRLLRLIATFEAAALQQLGKLAHPLTGEVGVNLEGARESIEILAMLERRMEATLNDEERRMLRDVLYHLRMNYVEVARAGAKESQ
jgi:hypothetical protein